MEIVKTALMITCFVTAMMLMVEYVNVITRGDWRTRLAGRAWGQYVLAALLGVMPGCLGAFTAVAMYTHGVLTLGALVTAGVAASGDEVFVMLALVPRHAAILMALLFVFGLAAGFAVDAAAGKRKTRGPADCLELHLDDSNAYPRPGLLAAQWRKCSAARGILVVALGLALGAIIAGELGPAEWNWIRATLAAITAGGLFVAATVPDHFLEQHLWAHVARRHAPRIFVWTLGALAAMHVLTHVLQLETAIRAGPWAMLLIACLVGLIPESGPHLIFVTLFAEGIVPFSVLLASPVVQDGHGMLPLLAHSRREFATLKAITFSAGMLLGGAALSAGW